MIKTSNCSDSIYTDNKFSIKRHLSVFFMFVFIIALVTSTLVSEAATPKTTKVTMSKTSVSVYKGQKYQLKATKANKKVKHKSIKWSTSNKKVVTVNQKGLIKGVKKGNAYVYCKVKWKNNKTTTVKCKVKVYNPVKLKSYKLSKSSATLKVGQKITVKKVIIPSNATIIKTAIATSNKKVAIINSKGVITAKGPGTAKLCVAIKTYNNKVYKRYVTVKVWVPETSVKLDKTSSNLYVGQSTTLKAMVIPSNSTYKTITYKSSDEKVAKVSSSGIVTALGVGNASITATTKNGKVATYKVNVLSPYEIKIDKTSLELKEEVSGDVKATVTRYYGDAKAISYSSSNEKVASIDKEGEVVAVSEGIAVITASVVQPTVGVPDKYNKVTCTVKVTKPDVSLQYIHEPYVSTYYFNARPSYKEDVIIPIYLTDTDQKEYIELDYSKRFDLCIEVDKEKTYLRDLKAGDMEVNLGKLSKGHHYFSLQVIDKDSGLKSHKLYNQLRVIDEEEYKITEEETYYVTQEDLDKYGIKNNNSTDAEDMINTRDGLSKMFVDIRDEGYDKCVLLNGIYRINGKEARDKCITIPSYFTVDMNGSTFKLDTITEDVSGCIARMYDTVEAHLTNGILEGDRFERRDLGLETGYLGEGINTFGFKGAQFSSITNMIIKQTTGHTVGTNMVQKSGRLLIEKFTNVDIVDGKEISCDTRSTSEFKNLTSIKNVTDYMKIGYYQGYKGIKGDSPIIYVHFYDKDKKYMHTVTGYQFRNILIPEDAVYGRVTFLAKKLSIDDSISFYDTTSTEYSEISNVDFVDTRTTAIAPSDCSNLLITDVRYTRAGNSITPCAVDMEDGRQHCQDVYYMNNKVLEGAGTVTLIDNSGYNHVYDNNKGHSMEIRRGVLGATIRNTNNDKDFIHWSYGNKKISKYHRFEGNTTGNAIVNVSEEDIVAGAIDFKVRNNTIKFGHIYRYSEPSKVTYENCTFPNFAGGGMSLKNCTITPDSYLNDNLYFKNCIFKNINNEQESIRFRFNKLNAQRTFDDCKFYGKVYMNSGADSLNSGTFNNCYFENMCMVVKVSTEENNIPLVFNNCEINSKDDSFIYFGPFAYSTGYVNVQFNKCKINLDSSDMIHMFSKPIQKSSITFRDCVINKDNGKLINGNGSIKDNAEVELNVLFKNTQVPKDLDVSYLESGNKVVVQYYYD